VSAIVEDAPGNSTWQFDFVNTFNYSGDFEKRADDQLAEFILAGYTYKHNPAPNLKTIEKKINDIKYSHDPSDKKISSYFAFSMHDWAFAQRF
jgi:hypothetical protein